jgi:hypothetical protein
MSGYTQGELDGIQAKWNLRFPPDLVELLKCRRKVIDLDGKVGSFDWLEETDETIRDALEWPFQGFLFDVQNSLWWPEWGEMPIDLEQREGRLRSIFLSAPKLIPVYGHRYIPEEPFERHNPIFSVYQMDVIHYGANLEDYIMRETKPDGTGSCPQPGDPGVKRIPFWTRAVEFNNERFQNGGSFAFFNKDGILPSD